MYLSFNRQHMCKTSPHVYRDKLVPALTINQNHLSVYPAIFIIDKLILNCYLVKNHICYFFNSRNFFLIQQRLANCFIKPHNGDMK